MDRQKVQAAFGRATAIDPEFAPAFLERARCGLASGELEGARRDALRAVELAPSDDDSSLLVAEIAERRGDAEEARRYRLGVRVRGVSVPREVLPVAKAGVGDVDRALSAGDLAGARRAAIGARMAPAMVALRAVALGKGALAREQAGLVLAADPADADARVALLASADLVGDAAGFAVGLEAVPERGTAPSLLGRLLLAEVLRRRVAVESGGVAEEAGGDALIERVRARRAR